MSLLAGLFQQGDSIAAEDITDAGATGIELVKAATPAAAREAAGVVASQLGIQLRDTMRNTVELQSSTATQFSILILGDSWSDFGSADWVDFIRRLTKINLGDGGPGWINCLNAPKCAARTDITSSRTGTWADSEDSRGLDNCLSKATANGANWSLQLASAITATSVKLHYFGQAGGGTIQYRFNGGAWTQIDTSAKSGYQVATLAGVPATAAYLLEVNALSAGVNGCILFGADFQNASGARVHRMSHGGYRTTNYAGTIADSWTAALAGIDPTLSIVLLGTNDQTLVTPAQYATNLGVIVDRIRAAKAGADICIVAPCENLAGRATPMSEFAAQAEAVAVARNCMFIDLSNFFGHTVAEYNDTAPRVLMASGDPLHPTAIGRDQVFVAIADTLGLFGKDRLSAAEWINPANAGRVAVSTSSNDAVIQLNSNTQGGTRCIEYSYGAARTALFRAGYSAFVPNTWYSVENATSGGRFNFTANRNLYVGNGTSDFTGNYGIYSSGIIGAGSYFKLPEYTVATLPSVASGYGMAMITDSAVTQPVGSGSAPTGGGTNKVVGIYRDGGWFIL